MINFLLAVLMLVAMLTLIPITGLLGLWMKGADNILLPGLGLIVATPILFGFFVVVEIAVILLTAYLVRYIPVVRELVSMIQGSI